MASPPPPRAGPDRRWHRLVEHYTPDGVLGRFLFACGSGTAAVLSFWLAAVGLTSFGLLPTLAGFVGIGATLVATLLTIVVLWPVYLSLIGNVESAAAYVNRDATVGSGSDVDDPVALLQYRYAAGEVSQEEFERRLDDLLQVEDLLEPGELSSPTPSDEGERLPDTAGR